MTDQELTQFKTEHLMQAPSGVLAVTVSKVKMMELINDLEHARKAYIKTAFEVEQTLGKALKYPKFEGSETVCTGDHVPETLAAEAARLIETQSNHIEELQKFIREGVRDDDA